MTDDSIKCVECGLISYATAVRVDRCKRCYARHYSREKRRTDYHERIKHDPALLEAHRADTRERIRRHREAHRDELNARRRERARAARARARLNAEVYG